MLKIHARSSDGLLGRGALQPDKGHVREPEADEVAERRRLCKSRGQLARHEPGDQKRGGEVAEEVERRQSLQLLYPRLLFHLRPDNCGEDRAPADDSSGCATAEVDDVHRCPFSHIPGQPPILWGRGRAARPSWPGSSGTVRIPAAVGRHPKVPAGWNVAARRAVTPRCYRPAEDQRPAPYSGNLAQRRGKGISFRCIEAIHRPDTAAPLALARQRGIIRRQVSRGDIQAPHRAR